MAKQVEEKLQAVKDVKDGEDTEAIKKSLEELNEVAMKLGEHMYKPEEGAAGEQPAEGEEKKEDGPVEAEYEEVSSSAEATDDKKNEDKKD